MAIAGFCRTCGQNVWCDEQGNCSQGHPKTEVGDWYDPETGQRLDFSAPAQPVAPPVDAVAPSCSEKDVIVSEIYQALLQKTGYNMTAGTDTDLVIDSEVANANWATGKKKVEYSAIMKVEELERTIYWWEMVKESGSGLSFGTMGSESYSTVGTKRWGTTKEIIIGPDGVAVDYSWDYAATRKVAEEIAAKHGYKVKVVLRRKSAQR